MGIDHARMPDHEYIDKKASTYVFFSDYRACLAELTERERNVLNLWYDKYMKHAYTSKEISKKLGISESTVEKTKKLAMEKIKNNPRMAKYKGLLG